MTASQALNLGKEDFDFEVNQNCFQQSQTFYEKHILHTNWSYSAFN